MSDQERESPPTAPGLPTQRMRLHSRRQLRERLDDMLRAYWGDLIARSEPLAVQILERAEQKFARDRTAETIP